MDDFNLSSLQESKNEWSARLLTILSPLVIEGLKSIFDESLLLCKSNNEINKYLMTFQNLITQIPKWNPNVIENEKKRIIEKSHCHYLEELVTCVHIIQLKILTSMRVGNKQKKIDIDIPKLDDFIHKIYINVARKVYKNVYLFELSIPPLQIQKNNRELELIVQECILNTIRENIPIENILKAYMDESIEEEIIEELKEEIIENKISPEKTGYLVSELSEKAIILEKNESNDKNHIKFSDIDNVRNINNMEELINAPKDFERLEEISNLRNSQRKLEEEENDDEEENIKLKIHDDKVKLTVQDYESINNENQELLNNDLIFDDIEILT